VCSDYWWWKPEGKRQLGRPRYRGRIIFKWILRNKLWRAWSGLGWLFGWLDGWLVSQSGSQF